MNCPDCNTKMKINSKDWMENEEVYWVEYECPNCEAIIYEEEAIEYRCKPYIID